MQKIRFGLFLDGQRGWRNHDSFGESVVGPLGMLTLLETQLGLAGVQASQSERVVQMRECLHLSRTGSRFYETTFQVDELGTASTLLRWRDLWFEHGWEGQAGEQAGPRLRDMAAVEALAGEKVAPGAAQRLMAVEDALDLRRPQIDRILLVDPMDEFPKAWRRVLAKLPVEVEGAPILAAEPGSMLRSLQDAVLASQAGENGKPLEWRADGTLTIVRGESLLAAGQWVARQIRLGSSDHVVVAERSGSALDATLAAAGLPRLGLSEPSAYRPTLQLLPLAMRLLWDPLDIPALIQFLTHPVHPLPGRVRYRIARKMADAPGIGGSKWDALLAEIDERAGDDAEKDRVGIAFWIDHERFRPEGGAPLTFVYERAERLASFFRRGMQDPDGDRRSAWMAGHGQAMALRESIQAMLDQGVERIAREALDRLVDQATARGSANPLLEAEAGAAGKVSDPSALIEPFESVLWWQLAAVPMPRPWPWSRTECAELQEAGVELPAVASLLFRQARSWLRPILLAQKCLTLVLPPPAEEPHPVWLLVSAALADPLIETVEDVLTTSAVTGQTQPVPHQPLPARRRWWQLPPGVSAPWPETTSYSSLEKLLFNPSHWALHYGAKLRPSEVLTAPDASRLLGSLAHRVVEQLYREEGSLQRPTSAVLAWFDANVSRIVSEEGAVLQMAGKRAELAAFRLRFRHSLGRLHEHLRTSGAVKVVPEKALEGSSPFGKLAGSADLAIVFGDGRKAVLDMKWSGLKWYRDKLKAQTHLQLCIYANLEQGGDARWPEVAYYVLKEAEMLTTAGSLFPDVRPIQVVDQTPLLWNRMLTTWAWRKSQLDRGAIEVVMPDIEATPESEPPVDGLEIEVPNTRYNPYVHLAGWRD